MPIVVLAMVLALAPPAGAAERPAARWLHGVRVMPGGAIVGNHIVYRGGDVIVVPSVGDSFDSCVSGFVCLFDSVGWTGSSVQFNSCCAWNNLSAFGFNDRASSWRNRMSVDAQIAKDPGGGGAKMCLNNGSFAASMPSGWDNAASSIRVRNAATYC